MKECAVCGDEFEPDSCMRRLCPECRDLGYRKADPARGLRTLVSRVRMPILAASS